MRTAAKGFTLVEVILVMGMLAVIAGVVFVNQIRPQNVASLDGVAATLVADIKSQQVKAMAGDSVSASSAQAHGVRIQSGTYTLFKGSSYSAGDTDNFTVTAATGVTLSTTFASSVLIFTKATGDITSFVNGQNTITLTSAATGTSKVITLNRYGAVTVN